MPSNIQYNTPMPIYSREAAEEEFRQQYGEVPNIPLGASDKHFDPLKSETLKAINEGVGDDIGAHFFEKVAAAEAPHIPLTQEPAWTEYARSKAQRARSATPSAPRPSYQPSLPLPSFTHSVSPRPASDYRGFRNRGRGYEFGGLDYTTSLPSQNDAEYYYVKPRKWEKEKRVQPGYEMGGMDFRKNNFVQSHGPYHGYGPQVPKLHPKFGPFTKQSELNIESPGDLRNVDPDTVIGDTLSNQKIMSEKKVKQWGEFGTAFGPLQEYSRQQRQRAGEPQRSNTMSISAGIRQKDSDGYQRRSEARSRSAVPMERYRWNETGDKEVTIETLLNDSALIPRKRSVTPNWYSKSVDKHNRWSNTDDPRLTRPQIPPEQPPYWYSKANQTHSSWQNVADRQMTQETRQQQQSEVNASYATQNDYHRPSERAQSPTLARSENAIALPYQSISSQQTYERQQQQQQQEQQTSRSNHVEYAANALDGSASRENRYIPVGAPQLGIKSSEQGVVEEQYNRSQSQQRSYETTYKDSSMIKPYSSQFYQYDSSSRQQNQAVTSSSRAPGPEFSAKAEMAEVLPNGSLANTHAHTEGSYRDREGNNVNYKRELLTSVDPSHECQLMKEEEQRICETPLEPGVISRHVTTKYYKKKTVTDTTTTTSTQ